MCLQDFQLDPQAHTSWSSHHRQHCFRHHRTPQGWMLRSDRCLRRHLRTASYRTCLSKGQLHCLGRCTLRSRSCNQQSTQHLECWHRNSGWASELSLSWQSCKLRSYIARFQHHKLHWQCPKWHRHRLQRRCSYMEQMLKSCTYIQWPQCRS